MLTTEGKRTYSTHNYPEYDSKRHTDEMSVDDSLKKNLTINSSLLHPTYVILNTYFQMFKSNQIDINLSH